MNAPRDVLCSIVGQVLETMYFCQAECAGPGLPPSPALGSRIAVSGELRGEFIVMVTMKLALRLAADFVAAEIGEMSGSQAAEIVHEFANVACGAALAEWMPQAKLAFSVPCAPGEAEAGETSFQCFRVDNAPEAELAVSLVLAPA